MSTRRKQEREWHRQFILERAAKEFAQCGYEGTTMDRIAEAAEVSKGTLYNYFSGKQEIFFSILHYGMDQVLKMIDQALEEERPIEEKVRILTTLFLEFFQEGGEIHRILMVESERIMMAVHMNLGKMMREHISAFISHLVNFMREGQEAGVFRKTDPELAAMIFMNIITADLKHTLVTGKKRPAAIKADEISAFALGALCGPPHSPKTAL